MRPDIDCLIREDEGTTVQECACMGSGRSLILRSKVTIIVGGASYAWGVGGVSNKSHLYEWSLKTINKVRWWDGVSNNSHNEDQWVEVIVQRS